MAERIFTFVHASPSFFVVSTAYNNQKYPGRTVLGRVKNKKHPILNGPAHRIDPPAKKMVETFQ